MFSRISAMCLAMMIPSVVFVVVLWALLGSIKSYTKTSAKIPSLQRGDSVVVITPQGTYNLFIYCEGDGYLKCTDEEGQLHIFRGVYEIHQKQLPEKQDPNMELIN